ncbi:MAG: hypothetical protein WAK14_10580 [Methanobacterium sp.]
MHYNNENNFTFTMDLRDDDDNIWAAISVIPSKEAGKRDILLIDANNGNFSFRSITELINFLQKKKVSFYERKKVLDFLANSLLYLEKNQL